jgi:hypothetical protein
VAQPHSRRARPLRPPRSSRKWSDAKALCGDDLTCDNPADLTAGNQLVGEARSAANVSTALVIGGAVVVSIGAVLIITPPREMRAHAAWRLAPVAGPSAIALTLDGRF